MDDDQSIGVIYVEDDNDVRIGGVQALELAGLSVSGFASVETALWDPTDRSLVAHGSQVMYLVFPDSTPTGDARLPPDQRPPAG